MFGIVGGKKPDSQLGLGWHCAAAFTPNMNVNSRFMFNNLLPYTSVWYLDTHILSLVMALNFRTLDLK